MSRTSAVDVSIHAVSAGTTVGAAAASCISRSKAGVATEGDLAVRGYGTKMW